MSDIPSPGQACTLSWRQFCSDLYSLLERPDPAAFTRLRMLASGRLREMPIWSAEKQEMAIELLLLDVHAALTFSTAAMATACWQLLDSQCSDSPGSQTPAYVLRARYIATVQMLQAGLLEERGIDLAGLRRDIDLEAEGDRQLVRALLLEALLTQNHKLAMRACCIARIKNNQPIDQFGLLFQRLCLALLEQRADAGQLAELLENASTYLHWQLLDGPLWLACLDAEVIPLPNWSLHLQAHERCHAWLYREIERLQA